MNAKRRQGERGLSLIETMVSLVVLAIAMLGLFEGVVFSLNSNALARRRTQMKELAQGRLERLLRYRPLAVVVGGQIAGLNAQLALSNVALLGAGTVDASQPPGGTGWMFDTLETASASTSDALAWPIHVDRSAATFSDAVTAQAASLNSSVTSCADAQVVNDPAVLCREIHLEDVTATAGVPMVRAYVRVLRGGTGAAGALLLSEDIAP